MFDTINTEALALLESHRAHLPDDAVLTQADANVTRFGATTLNAFWCSAANENLWGVVGLDDTGAVLLRTWTPGSETPAIVNISADGVAS